MQKYYHIVTYGCQMNVHESEKLAGMLADLGYIQSDEINNSDIILFNTCCIRENAEHRAYGNIGALKKMKKENPDRIIGVCGCMTQQKGSAEKLLQKFPFVDIVFGTHNIHKLKELIELKVGTPKPVTDVWDSEGEIVENVSMYRTSGVNAWVNITFGCNNFCTYCIVPYVRGRERSRSLDDVITEVKELLNEGYKEITLLGQNVNSYGNDLKDGTSFAKLLDCLGKIPGKFRIRFMTSHPKDLSDEVIKVINKYDNICSYIHLPVQAGSNNILEKMNRRYTREKYLDLVEKIKTQIKNVQISSDLMVGFPGETEEDFKMTLDLVEKSRFASAFTFIYSRRSGTVADKMENQIDEQVKTDRIKRLIKLQNGISREISKTYIGKTYEVLCEGRNRKDPDLLIGRTDCGRLVCFPGTDELIGKFINIKINGCNALSLKGEVEC